MSTTMKIVVVDEKNNAMEERNENYPRRNWEAPSMNRYLDIWQSPSFSPRVLGVQASHHRSECGGFHRMAWEAVGSNPFSNQSPRLMVHYVVDSVIGTLDKVFHEL